MIRRAPAVAWVLAFAGVFPGAALRGQDAAKPATFQMVAFPRGNLFAPLIADPKQPRLLGAFADVHFPTRAMTVAAAAVGEDVGILRWPTKQGGVQVGLAGGIFAQFDLDAPSKDLVNADYLIGLPLTFRWRLVSARVEVYHQSSHLGDEYLLHQAASRLNLSMESVALLVAVEPASRWRLYGGGEYLMGRDPVTLGRTLERVGLEFRGGGVPLHLGAMGRAHPIMAIDLRSWEQHDWLPALSFNAGLHFRPDHASPEWSGRTWSLLFVLYRGPSPYGQFYSETISYTGAALQLGF
jgi:hypothetical protein